MPTTPHCFVFIYRSPKTQLLTLCSPSLVGLDEPGCKAGYFWSIGKDLGWTLSIIQVRFRCRPPGDCRQSFCRRSDRSNFGSTVTSF